MKTNLMILSTVFSLVLTTTFAQNVKLHVNPRWEECSIQLDPSLTQQEWHRFTEEAGLVSYFRPVTDARPMGAKRFELAILQWNTGIDETVGAWNNTFVHPYSEHWLIGGDELPFPGLMLRAGVSPKVDVGAYYTARPGANYGLIGAQVQYSLLNDVNKNWALASRLGFNNLHGPDDVNLTVYGLDLLASKYVPVSSWLSLSPYAGLSSYYSHAHEKSDLVNLHDENILGGQGMVGAVAQLSFLRLGVEYNFARVNTLSYKLGFSYQFKSKS